ncbi:MAG: hypothetical protein PHR30_08320 [Gallionellaceae bacterium]|nr:hypothetical protein [Gallionellaceae bacterium]
MENWNDRLMQIANENPDASGEIGERLRAHVKAHVRQQLIQDVQLSHARAREAIVTGARQAFRTGALLLTAPRGDLLTLLRAAGISTRAASEYIRLALAATSEQRQRCLRRRGRITESEAMGLLHGTQTDRDLHPSDSLHALDVITDAIINDQGGLEP